MTDVKTLQADRQKLYSDYYNNIIPQRMPAAFDFSARIAAEYGKIDPFEYQFDFIKLRGAVFELAEKIYSDNCPFFPPSQVFSRLPGFYQILGSQSFVMGNNGFMQHPEVIGMLGDEYAQLTANPFDFLVETVIPRQYKALDSKDPFMVASTIMTAQKSMANDANSGFPIYTELMQRFGYYPGAPLGSSGFSAAPFDFIADQLRSFSGISTDVRRKGAEIKDACEAVLPLLFVWGQPALAHPEGIIMQPLHMPTYMRPKDFADLWLPTYQKMTEQYAALNMRSSAFCEHDWSGLFDHIQELPAGMRLMFEYGDPKTIKDKLGKKFLIAGLYPVTMLATATKQQCVDKAKELLDIMLPDGGYIFGFDKQPLTLKDLNLENYIALSEFVRDYAKYDNAGASFGTPLNTEKFAEDPAVSKIESKYLFDWDSYKAKYPLTPDSAKPKLETAGKEVLRFFMNLLV